MSAGYVHADPHDCSCRALEALRTRVAELEQRAAENRRAASAELGEWKRGYEELQIRVAELSTQDGEGPEIDMLPHFIAGVLSGFPAHAQEHPEERVAEAAGVLSALYAQGFKIERAEDA